MNEHDQKHLTLSNRTYIEQELLQKSTFSSIGSVLHKDPSTISKEVKRYSKTIPAGYSYKCNLCKHYKDCDLRSKELKCPRYSSHCSFYCKKCNKINKPPYVCKLLIQKTVIFQNTFRSFINVCYSFPIHSFFSANNFLISSVIFVISNSPFHFYYVVAFYTFSRDFRRMGRDFRTAWLGISTFSR